jgi:hypothetical protein
MEPNRDMLPEKCDYPEICHWLRVKDAMYYMQGHSAQNCIYFIENCWFSWKQIISWSAE